MYAPKAVSIPVATLSSQHCVFTRGLAMWCENCAEHRLLSDKVLLRAWLSSPCVGETGVARRLNRSLVKPLRLGKNSDLCIGRCTVHDSHPMWTFLGLAYCSDCGAVASRKVQSLTKVCPGIAPKHGVYNLRAITNGDLPPGFDRWPAQAVQRTDVQL